MTSLRLPPLEIAIGPLEAHQRALYERLADLRAQGTPAEGLRELILEIDEHDARVAAARSRAAPAPPVSEYAPAPPPPLRPPAPDAHPPAPAQPASEAPRGRASKILLVTAALAVGAAAAGALLLHAGGSDSATAPRAAPATVPVRAPAATAAPQATSVGVRLHTDLENTPCGGGSWRTSLRWTWTVPPGYDGETATVTATGPGLAAGYRLPVVGVHVRLSHADECLPAGSSWTVNLDAVGSTPARLVSAG